MQQCRGVCVSLCRRSADLQNHGCLRWLSMKSSSVVFSASRRHCCVASSKCPYMLKRSYATRPAVVDAHIVKFVQGCENFASERSSQHIPLDPDKKSSDATPNTVALTQIVIADKLKKDHAISLHFRKSDLILNVQNKNLSNFSLFIPREKEVYHITADDDAKPSENITDSRQTLGEEPAPNSSIESIEEHLWKECRLDLRRLPQLYLQLSKIRLTGLVVLTAMAGYAIAPGAFEPTTFLLCTVGTGLTSCAANSINQFLEVPFDAQMNRTKNRVLVRKYMSELHAVTFAVTCGFTGLTMLTLGVNSITAALGAFNLALYTMAYTPMKRITSANTWLGSIVGAVPPMMGWAASTGGLEAGAWLLAAVMFAWQFPHFCALSWNLRPDYSRAGFQMLSVVNPAMCKRVALRYCLVTTGVCLLFPVFDVTTWAFAADSLPLNIYLSYLGWRFYQDGDSNSSRKLFRFTLLHVPVLLILMLLSKKSYGKRTNDVKPSTDQLGVQSL